MSEIANPPIGEDKLKDHKSRLVSIAKFFRTKRLGAAGLVIVIVYFLIAIFADVISPYHPLDVDYKLFNDLPSSVHWLGTDEIGRDLLSRLFYGARTALLIGFIASLVGSTLGMLIGVASAYFGGVTDLIVQRFVDVFISFPTIILALTVATIIPEVEADFLPESLQWLWPDVFATTLPVIIAITIPIIPDCARVLRSSSLSLRELPYVDAARAMGFSHWRIITRHMIPNVMAPYLILVTAFMGQAVLLEASLTYLGLGVQEPTPAWGLMLQGAAEQYARSAPHTAVIPGLAITTLVLGFSVFGDALRDVLDPRLRI